MADEDKPKPLSIKERMAAFQQAANQPAAPPPRPAAKPSNWTWKQKQAEAAAAAATTPSPASGPSQSTPPVQEREVPQVDERADRKAGMSAGDAQEAIKGQSLKERMAALQGKGFNSAPEPAPKPSVPSQPRVWKRPVVPQPDEEGGEGNANAAPLPISLQPAQASLSPSHESENPAEVDTTTAPEGEGTGPAETTEDAEGDDEEERERQRRAAIAARMAKLGGARAGLGAPLFGRPPARSPSPSVGPSPETSRSNTAEASQETPTVAARIPLPSLASASSISTIEQSTSPPVETPSSAGETIKSPPLSVPKRALPPRKKSAQKQTSVDSETSLNLPPPTTGDVESAPAVATAGEAEDEAQADPATHEPSVAVESRQKPEVSDEYAEDAKEEEDEAILEPTEVETKTVVAKPPPPVIEHPAESYEDQEEVEETEEPKEAPIADRLAPTAPADDDARPISPATALGQNAMSLLQDEEDEDEEEHRPTPAVSASAPVPPPPASVVPPSHIPPALRSQLDEEEDPEEDGWDDEAPPARVAVPPPPPVLSSRFEEHERSETQTPLPPSVEDSRPPVPAGLASASPTSPKSRPLPNVPGSPVVPPVPHAQSPPSRQASQSQEGAMSERPARRSLPPPPPPPPAHVVPRADDEDEGEENVGAVGEGAHH